MKACDNSQTGFSIVEMMIAMTLSAILLLGVVQIFDANQHSSRLQHAYAEVQEAGRIATELLARDIRMADYWGCLPDSDAINDNVHLPGDENSFTNTDGIEGEDNVASQTIDTITVKAETDKLTMKGAGSLSGAKVGKPYMNTNSAAIHLNKGNKIPEGTILMISDCGGGDVFKNTSGNTETSGTLGHNKGGGNHTKDLSRTYNASAQIMIPVKRIYFIGQNPDAGWSLYWSDNGVVEELVRNVDDLQFIYGEDTNGDGAADKFGVATAVNMDNVISVRATFNVFSSDQVFDGQPLNRAYTLTANIRNRSL